jgi:Tol biopolymer transport system component
MSKLCYGGALFTCAVFVAADVGKAHSLSASSSVQLGFVRGGSIGVVSLDGRNIHFIMRARGRFSYYDPAWSRSGRLAFTIQEETESHAYYYVAVKRPGQKRLLLEDYAPTWAPDNKRFALVEGGGMWGGLLGVARVGGGERSLGPGSRCCSDDEPAWSPNGTLIAFTRATFGPQPEEEFYGRRLFLIHPDGTGLRRVSKTSVNNPSWSPDSRRIVFDDGHRLKVINVDGSGLRTLYDGGADDIYDPSCSRDGGWIAFSHGSAIWIIGSDGEGAHLLLPHAEEPAWKTP